MNDYILFMHDDAPASNDAAWPAYLAKLRAAGVFSGGSAIGDGICVKRAGTPPPLTQGLTGYLRIQAASLDEARQLLVGNPVFEAGGTVEIRLLPRD